MKRFLLLLLFMACFVACDKSDNKTISKQAQEQKKPSVSVFEECNKLYKDPKATENDIDLCRIRIYEKDPDGVRKQAEFYEIDDVVGSYWDQGEGFKAIELRNASRFNDDEDDDDDEEESPDLKELQENIANAKFELADYYIKEQEYKKAFELLQELSSWKEYGKADIAYALAYLYFNGLGVEKNEEKAKQVLDTLTVNDSTRWGATNYIVHDINSLRKGAEKNDSFSRYVLAQIYNRERMGLGIQNGCHLAFRELNKAVENGYAPAMDYLAVFYWDDAQLTCGHELGDDQWGIFSCSKAVDLYTKAANLGYVPSQIMLGDVYTYGEDFLCKEPNPKLAFKWYSQAAKSNDPDALFNMIRVLYQGLGTSVNYKQAFDYAQRIKDVEPSALIWLGKMYFYGKGTKQDYKKAFEVLNQWKSVDGEHFNNRYYYENAYYLLGLMYQKGLGTKQDLEKAKEYFKEIGKEYMMATDDTYPVEFLLRNVVENNNAQAQKVLEGKELQDSAKTMLEYAKKAYAGDSDSMYKLGSLLHDSENQALFYPKGTKDDKTDCDGAFETEAYKWIKKAATLGNADAQFMLGEAYETGVIPSGTAWWYGHCMTDPVVVSKDETLAQEWYQKAAKQGHAKAQEKIKKESYY